MTTTTTARTTLDDAAVAISDAAANVDGVHALGGVLMRAADAVRQRIGSTTSAPGVKVDKDRSGHVTVAVSVVVEYPHKIRDVADAVRDAARTVAAELGSNSVAVTVTVTDVFGPFDTDPVEAGQDAVDDALTAAGDAVDDAATATREAADDVASATREAADDVASATRRAVDEAAEEDGNAPRRSTAADADPDAASNNDAADAHDVVADALDEVADDIAAAADDARDRARQSGA
ncbi:Asp23/Gls24 family envelope stress response protein [Microbacterium sp. LMI1-1-1.1]|uniref:Asp23/Gls24 family envelope stress response protein n=1 Tax=Microbacterium sp. LMI1-1-1.1 TaxID=3135223 RepID=UPI0034661B5A